mgnify:CR=1 FL=1
MRKRPGQQRSQQMVDILLEASGRVIARQGLASLTTNRVADEAGVSIGSLYQYFANKQELLEGLLERMALDMTRLIDARMTQLLAADVRTAVKMLLGEMLAFIRGGDGRYLEVVRHWQQLQTLQVVDRLEQHLSEVCRRYLLRHVREYPIENPIPVLFVIINGTLMTLAKLCAKHAVDLISIGNGTASRETDKLAADLMKQLARPEIQKVVVSEAGASVYSASEFASQEMPDVDVSLRGAASIARRLQDPLAELVKIDPKSIGVGQYQHDVNQSELARTLDAVVEDCVNGVGVDLNTASAPLLARAA